MEINSIIASKQIRTVFQPILSLRDGGILGFEALSRPTFPNSLTTVEGMFEAAKRHNLLWELEYLTRSTAIESAARFMRSRTATPKIFLNVSPVIIHDSRFRAGFTTGLLEKLHLKPKDIIFEITEKSVVTDIASFKATISHYKDQNFQIAIDDVGAGYSGLNLISEIAPHYLKLDMNLIRTIHSDHLKQGLIRGIAEFSNASNVLLIAEGIETKEELETVIHLGVQYGQGYFFQKPQADIVDIRPEVLETLREINFRKNHILHRRSSELYIKNICTPVMTVSPDCKIADMFNNNFRDSAFIGVCVVKDGQPVGVLTRELILTKFSGHFGFSLHRNKMAAELMDEDFLTVDEKKPVNVVSGLAMSRPHHKLYDFIVVTRRDKYLGVVTIKNLLLKTTEIEVSAAKHQNPLSGLPGNFVIEQRLSRCVLDSMPYSVAYFDLDNFKAYNDVYGFEKGDGMLRLLADTLKKFISDDVFVGHVGGDDFVVIATGHLSEDFFADTIRQFETDVASFYSAEDIAEGYISTQSRDGTIENYPLVSVTCVIVDNKHSTYNDVFHISEELAQLKVKCKHAKRAKRQALA